MLSMCTADNSCWTCKDKHLADDFSSNVRFQLEFHYLVSRFMPVSDLIAILDSLGSKRRFGDRLVRPKRLKAPSTAAAHGSRGTGGPSFGTELSRPREGLGPQGARGSETGSETGSESTRRNSGTPVNSGQSGKKALGRFIWSLVQRR